MSCISSPISLSPPCARPATEPPLTPTPLGLHEFTVVIHRRGEPLQQRTVWARRSVDVVLGELDDLKRQGSRWFRMQVKPQRVAPAL